MKTIKQSVVLSAALAILSSCAGFSHTCAAQDADEQQIERTILQFFDAMSKRDADGMKSAVHTSFTGVDAGTGVDPGRQNTRVEVVDPEKPDDLLPPPGNDDWKNVTISDVDAHISSTSPSVAMASFMLKIPLAADEIADLKIGLDERGPELDEQARKRLAKVIQDKARIFQMFAMLANDHGAWKIVCMTFPS